MSQPESKGAAQISAAVNSGETTALAVLDETLARIEAYDAVQPQIWISRAPAERLRAQAKNIDARIAAGDTLPLAGVPFAVKDNIDVDGFETTAGSPAFAYTPDHSAHVVAQLEAAGALCVGKTNLDQFATGLVARAVPSAFPPTPITAPMSAVARVRDRRSRLQRDLFPSRWAQTRRGRGGSRRRSTI